MKRKPIYIIGTGLSHDGSACLLKDGKIVVAIEKERITRIKHDGFNDSQAIDYCLKAEGITLKDLSLIVQNANFGAFEFGNDHFYGARLFDHSFDTPIVTISHHLAHAYNAIGTSPFKDTAVFVLDGCGSLFDECMDLEGSILPEKIDDSLKHLYAEKDSFYNYKDNSCKTVYKDFSPMGKGWKNYPMHPSTTLHSIGGIYSAASVYCFGNVDDPGKLMGLAPYGRKGVFDEDIFEMKEGRVFLRYDWISAFKKPARNFKNFKNNFQYYADIAYWMQVQVQKAILYIISHRFEFASSKNLSYTGGVALNAVANQYILSHTPFENLYITPAAGDNGLAIGCAYYGWLEVLKQERIQHKGNSCFGKIYNKSAIRSAIENFANVSLIDTKQLVDRLFNCMPLYLHKENAQLAKCTIQFNIHNCGVYVLKIDKGEVMQLKSYATGPDLTFGIDKNDFMNWMENPQHTFNLIESGKLIVEGDPGIMLFYFDLEKIKSEANALSATISGNGKKIVFRQEPDIYTISAELLSQGKIIGWFQDGSEFGPRALGHRSILADPRRKDAKEFINSRIKFREDFRPFAPSVISNEVSDYFQFEGESPYMIMVAQIKEKWKEKIPAVVHCDGSCRIQTVTDDWNYKYFKLLTEFKKITGIGVLLNTSFNKKGMPIVETPEQALALFFESAIDCLVMDNFIIYKDENMHLVNAKMNDASIVEFVETAAQVI